MNTQHLIFILYDSITNSVFESQVLIPLVEQKKNVARISIISYEPHLIPIVLQQKIKNEGIELHIMKRRSFICKELLHAEIAFCKNIIKNHSQAHIKARGPLAGYIALKALPQTSTKLTIQARGLLAEEYDYVHQHSTFPFNVLNKLRKQCYLSIERSVYTTKYPYVTIEAVSMGLKQYLIDTFATDARIIKIAQEDIPASMHQEIRIKNRAFLRKKYNISQQAYVYVYCGSAKPWQCPEEMIQFFLREYQKNKKTFLLIISQDTDIFKKIIQQHTISSNYLILALDYKDVIDHLCIADCGLLFRKPHTINWISRPTKLLEYKSVGLTIAHNNTVAELMH